MIFFSRDEKKRKIKDNLVVLTCSNAKEKDVNVYLKDSLNLFSVSLI